jgi:Helicase associated domain
MLSRGSLTNASAQCVEASSKLVDTMPRSKASGQGCSQDIPSSSHDDRQEGDGDEGAADGNQPPEVIDDNSDPEIVSQQCELDKKTKSRPPHQHKNSLEGKWQAMFARLLKFKAKHGHCLVPNRYIDDHALGAWVSTQRRQVSCARNVSDCGLLYCS